MSINNDNYEEYFLLYADGELSPEARQEVEAFVLTHPQHAEEFEMTKLAVNLPDEKISLFDKTFLYKYEDEATITVSNYEEYFVLYHDAELAAGKRKEVQEFLAKNPPLESEFNLIKEARLEPAHKIKFPDKSLLYKRESSRKVVNMFLYRTVAAALLAGFGLWIGFQYLNNREEQRMVASVRDIQSTPEKTETVAAKTITTPSNAQQKNDDVERVQLIARASHKEENQSTATKSKAVMESTSANDNSNANPSYTLAIHQTKEIETPPVQVEEIAAVTPMPNQKKALQNAAAKHIDVDLTDYSNTQNSYATTASLNEEPRGDDYIFFNISTEEFNKTKVAGFLKKVKRVIERNDPIKRLLTGDELARGN